MGKNDQWIYGESLRKQWDISDRLLESYVYDGLPAYDNENSRINPDNIDRVDGYRFKLKDINDFEIQNEHLFKNNEKLQERIMDGKASQELGRLRGQKEKWDSSIEVAVKIGIFCHEQNKELTRKEIWDQVDHINKNLHDKLLK